MKRLLLSLIFILPIQGMLLDKSAYHAPSHLGDISLYHNEDDGFSVEKENKFTKIHNYDVDAPLRKITPAQLVAFQKAGYLSVNQMDNGEYVLKMKVRGEGGGIVAAHCAYLGIKVAGYTAIFLGTSLANMMVPGAGTTATALALGTGGLAGAAAGIEAAAAASFWAVLVWPTI